MDKQALSAISIALTFLMFVPYVRSIRSGRTRPHLFSWLIWALSTLTVFFAQLAGQAGVGAWPIGVSGTITAYIAWLAYRHSSDRAATRADWIFLGLALLALPCWALTANPLWAVLILTGVDLVGFAPTFRSAYAEPYSEHLGFYLLTVLRNAVVILALEHYSPTTTTFPAAVGLACLIFVLMVWLRRRALASQRPASGHSDAAP